MYKQNELNYLLIILCINSNEFNLLRIYLISFRDLNGGYIFSRFLSRIILYSAWATSSLTPFSAICCNQLPWSNILFQNSSRFAPLFSFKVMCFPSFIMGWLCTKSLNIIGGNAYLLLLFDSFSKFSVNFLTIYINHKS